VPPKPPTQRRRSKRMLRKAEIAKSLVTNWPPELLQKLQSKLDLTYLIKSQQAFQSWSGGVRKTCELMTHLELKFGKQEYVFRTESEHILQDCFPYWNAPANQIVQVGKIRIAL